ncbi:MAG TPA: sulfur carrier protein ThiS [Gemmatimonadales bacterium]|jgi:thiamine biosynthesis protein ThiS|nr:sulfur carrier protein ThiS [Gemmatimonadales bacterium]
MAAVTQTTETVTVVINGAPRQVPRDATLLEVLTALGLDARLVVVEHNRRIVRRAALDAVRVAPGDAIELVHFVGGG